MNGDLGQPAGPGVYVSVGERVRAVLGDASTAERKVARVLLADYPAAGLDTAARLAERAGVSAPTVVRFVARLGFGGYRDLQARLREEVQERRTPPVVRATSGDGTRTVGALTGVGKAFTQAVDDTFAAVPEGELDRIVALLADRNRRVTCAGGRFSHVLAEYLDLHLRLLRPGTRMLELRPEQLASLLVDVGRRDVCVLFDFRRYQRDVVDLAQRVHAAGAKLVLFTDPWLSPAAAVADYVIPVRVEGPTPFDSFVAALAVVEALVSRVLTVLGADAEARLRRSDELVTDVLLG